MHALARLIALVAMVACSTRPAPSEQPGLDGLRAHLTAVRGGATRAWQVPRADWRGLVTEPYRDRYDDYAARFAAPAIPSGAIAVRWQYADDRTLAPAQRRERIALPVGRPGVIATVDGHDLPVVFVFDRGGWRALSGLDALTRAAIAGRDPACEAAYARAAEGPCMAAAAPVAIAALVGSPDEQSVACRRLIALPCGSVGAPP